MIRPIKLLSLFVLLLFIQNIQAQYFGKNKVKYKQFDYKVVESKTFDTYHYLEKDSLVIGIVKDAEKWRVRHEKVFKDSFDYKIPIILYNNHGDFQQTSVVSGLIGTSTGGVTEGLKNRVTFPITPSYTQTNHVLGHELVHAHQYNMIKSSDSLSFQNMGNIPLWMTEGMAEYLSIGSIDAHTAMWMRDAVAHDYFPRIKDLHKSRYFPYRYGQAFWAFVGGTFGDDKLYPLYRETAKFGVKEAFKRELGMPIDSFSIKWKETIGKQYKPLMKDRDVKPIGVKLIDEKNGGRLNISPSVSPDGKYFIFLSEKNIFTLDLFLTDANTGKIIKKLTTRTRGSHLDALDAFESAGTWSPDSKQYAFVIYSKGKNKLAIADIAKARVVDDFFIPNIPAFSNIDWSPDGRNILFSGLKDGQSDLFTINIDTKEVTQLTNDHFAQMQPKWSPDGKKIVYVTDHIDAKIMYPSRNLSFAVLDVKTRKSKVLKVFKHSNNLNPTYSIDGESIYFLSDREGFRDLYQFDIETGKVYQLTHFFTGISGITKYSPAISISREKKEILYSHYSDSKYNIYKVKTTDLIAKEVAFDDEDQTAAILPSMKLEKTFVDTNIENENILEESTKLKEKAYKPKFKLDYVSNGGIGISTGRYGTGMAGGINMLFGDMLNDNQLYVGAVLNGELQDFGAQAAYLNRQSRYAWGGGLSHIPYRFVTYNLESGTLPGSTRPAIKETYNLYRIFKEQISAFSYYPFSKATRLEGGASFNYYSFRLDKYYNYYNEFGQQYNINPEDARDRNVAGAGDSFGMEEVSIAFVGDDSSFGLTAPMNGYRYRLEVQQNFGELTMTALLADARKYFYLKPVTIAAKGYFYSRLGKDADNSLMPPLFLGYETLVRGYNSKAFYRSTSINQNSLQPEDILGNKMLVTNFEIRLPFTGPERLAVIKSGFLFTDLNLFFDAGLVWGESARYGVTKRSFGDSKIITSTGISTRINIFGQLILEPYYAFPLQLDGNSQGVFGLNFVPGW
jgi:WD40 repeat protein